MPADDGSLGGALIGVARADADAGGAVLRRHERKAWAVALISVVVMAGEIAAGGWLNSLALQSDGFHSGTHAGVLTIAASAYILARRRGDPARAVRTLNIAALVSGVLLGLAGLGLGVEAVGRFVAPEPVRFGEAAAITALGLVVSALSAVLLRTGHDHVHSPGVAAHAHGRDLNLWAAYLHMISDVVTSVIALIALTVGALTGWSQLDAAVGMLNALVVAGFSVRLLRTALLALLRRG